MKKMTPSTSLRNFCISRKADFVFLWEFFPLMGDSWILQGLIRNLRGTFELKTHPTSPLFFLQKCGLGGLVWFAVQPNFPIVNLTLLTGLWKCFKSMQPNSNGIWRSNLEGKADWLLYKSSLDFRGLAKWLKIWKKWFKWMWSYNDEKLLPIMWGNECGQWFKRGMHDFMVIIIIYKKEIIAWNPYFTTF